jgi:hypothetical protein
VGLGEVWSIASTGTGSFALSIEINGSYRGESIALL